MNFSELLVIALVALIVFGPDRLPTLAQKGGKWWRQFQHLKNKMDQEMEQQLSQFRLNENEAKAEEADAQYQRHNKSLEDKSV